MLRVCVETVCGIIFFDTLYVVNGWDQGLHDTWWVLWYTVWHYGVASTVQMQPASKKRKMWAKPLFLLTGKLPALVQIF